MPPPPPLSPALQQFIEGMGLYFERFELPRIGGRILGLLLVADRPLSLDDLANTLRVSRASISTNMRLITASSLAEQISLPGDRRDYYRFGPDTWERALRTELDSIGWLRRMAERGLAAASASESAAREHLDDLLEFCDLLMVDRRTTIERWRALLESKRARNAISPDGAGGQKQADAPAAAS
jgi:DNA-binding transcriptional regulator GbsR (MarR family)